METLYKILRMIVGTAAGLAVTGGAAWSWKNWEIHGFLAFIIACIGCWIISASLTGDVNCWSGNCDCKQDEEDEEETEE
jgi:hypothetical protein